MSVRFKVLRLKLIDLGDSWMTGMTAPAEISGEAKLQALVSSISSALVVENGWYSAPLNLSEHFVGIADGYVVQHDQSRDEVCRQVTKQNLANISETGV